MRRIVEWVTSALLILLAVGTAPASSAADTAKVSVQWDKTLRVSRTNATVLVGLNPKCRRNSPIHDQVFKALRELGADYVWLVAWHPYPKLVVAELEPPKDGKTFWDFSLIDPVLIDFFEATKGHPVVVDFCTIPQWMFKTPQLVAYPEDPNQVTWTYQQGTELRDPSIKELADYYARLVGWYTQGGFTDEYGKWHESGHHFKIDYWAVLNEVDIEHTTTPQDYAARYDAIVEAVRKVVPQMKFVGVMLALPMTTPLYLEYFLDPKNHKPGIPLDMVSYHFYVLPSTDEVPNVHQQFTFFDLADGFLNVVRYIEPIRQRLSPRTGTMINELGAIMPEAPNAIDEGYRNRYGALYAYLFAELTRLGIEVTAASQLIGFPSQFPSTSLMDWETGQPNAAYWALKLLRENFAPGDRVVDAQVEIPKAFPTSFVHATGFVKPDGTRKILLINKRERAFEVTIPGAAGAGVQAVDLTTRSSPPALSRLSGATFTLQGMGVAVVTLQK